MKLTKNNDIEPTPPKKVVASDSPKIKRNFFKKLSPSTTVLSAMAALGLLVGLIASYFIYDHFVVQARQQQLENLSQQKASLTSTKVANYFEGVQERITFFANQSVLRKALQLQDNETVKLNKQSITRQVDHVLATRFFNKGDAVLDKTFFPPVNYSVLSLIKQAERGDTVTPEAMKTEKGWVINYVAPIYADDKRQVDAVVWVSTSVDNLPALLADENQKLGESSLYQNFGKRNRVLVQSVGNANLETRAVVRVADSHWEVEFAANDNLMRLTHINIGLIYLMIIVVMVLSIAILAGLGFMLARAADAKASRQRMLDQMAGKHVKDSDDGLTDTLYQTKNLLDVQIAEEDASLLGLDDDDDIPADSTEELSLDDDVFDISEDALNPDSDIFPKEVFRAYDIRGFAKEQITKEFALALGQAFGSDVLMQREDTVVVARDARTHSPEITEWLIRGLLSTGVNVLNIGTVPTPLMYFAIETMDAVASGIMVTASHNDAPYNGFKLVLSGVARAEEDIKMLRQRMLEQTFAQGKGNEHHHDIITDYIDTIFSDVALAGEMSVVIDAANGVAGKVAPQLFEELGCRVTPLYCDLDGTFPNHSPDPSREENLQDLIAKVQEVNADLGIALDGDGDRLTVVTPSGDILWADKLLMLFAKDIISRNPGTDVVFDVKSTRHLNACITGYGGRPIMWKTGHSLMKQKMMETGAVVGAEYSGHIFIKDRWFGFDDGMYAAARLLEILSLQGEDIDTAFNEFPNSIATPEVRIQISEENKFQIVEKLKEQGDFGDGRQTHLDGLRVDFAYGWGLVRPSNTASDLTLRFEADDEESLHKIKSLFIRELRNIDSSIQIDWNQ